MTATSDRNPVQYARSKTAAARAYASGEVARWIREALPVVSPGVPVAGWIGVACNASIRENTTGWLTGSAAERAEAARTGRTPIRLGSTVYDPADRSQWSNYGFHELGVFGVEGGPATGPAPGAGDHGSWHRLASDATVRRVLGRAASTTPGGWVAVADQVVLGMANNVRHGRGVRALMPAPLRWAVDASGNPSRWSCWSFACATMAWSAGDAGAGRHLALGAEVVARAPEAERWGAWLRWLASSGPAAGPARNHRNPYYSAVRTAQKLECGRVAAEFTGEGEAARAWLAGGLTEAERAQVYSVLTARAYGGSTSSSNTSSSNTSSSNTSSSGPSALGVLARAGVAFVGVLGAGVLVARRFKRRGA